MARPAVPPPDAFQDLERALAGGPQDAQLELWAARFYAWAAHRPPAVRGPWHADPAGAKARCLALLRRAVEHGVPDAQWKPNSTFQFLFGDPKVYARDWATPGGDVDSSEYWRMGNPLIDFGG